MKRKKLLSFLPGAVLLVLFVLFTRSLAVVDVQPIGPEGSCVAYATVNGAVHRLFGVHMVLYHITDWAGVAAILVAMGFGVLGLTQWIRRKSLGKVDRSLLLLGLYYVLVFGTYLFFEGYVVNRRPVLIGGILEASYPSSTTVLVLCVMPTAGMQLRRRLPGRKMGNGAAMVCGLFAAAVVLGRLVSGVHWFTDILGGMLFSLGAVLLYRAAESCLE